MVKREAPTITVGSAATTAALGDSRKSIKREGAWRYPGGIIQRADSTVINGRSGYYDHKDAGEKLPRRKQESNFFITLNTNRVCGAGGELAVVGQQAMKGTLEEMATDEFLCKYLKFGPKHPEHYSKDVYQDVIQKIEWNSAVEIGENLERLHCHIWLTVHHYSQVQINMPVMQHMFKRTYNDKLQGHKYRDDLKCNGMPYIQVKLLPESNWAEVMKQYIHKAMQQHTGEA